MGFSFKDRRSIKKGVRGRSASVEVVVKCWPEAETFQDAIRVEGLYIYMVQCLEIQNLPFIISTCHPCPLVRFSQRPLCRRA